MSPQAATQSLVILWLVIGALNIMTEQTILCQKLSTIEVIVGLSIPRLCAVWLQVPLALISHFL